MQKIYQNNLLKNYRSKDTIPNQIHPSPEDSPLLNGVVNKLAIVNQGDKKQSIKQDSRVLES